MAKPGYGLLCDTLLPMLLPLRDPSD